MAGNLSVTTSVLGRELLHSAFVHLNNAINEVVINVNTYIIKVSFFEDGSGGGPKWEAGIEGAGYYVKLINHRQVGEHYHEPIVVGVENEKKIYLTYNSSLLNPSTGARRFEYCLWLEL